MSESLREVWAFVSCNLVSRSCSLVVEAGFRGTSFDRDLHPVMDITTEGGFLLGPECLQYTCKVWLLAFPEISFERSASNPAWRAVRDGASMLSLLQSALVWH